ncbi:glycosyltransferase [Sphingomonas sp. R86521]|uniref:glycosyltransferase n=1 Tax=Sphingomonas sp. R86521 TaxID=3093860 RepID=UPI0036D42CB2
MMIDATKGDIVAVTVTYGERRDMLFTVLDALRVEGATHVIVVDNGASWPVAAELTTRLGGFVKIVSMGGNTGSARGYVAGIEAAMASRLPFIWLLDDDNLPRPGCLATLRKAYKEEIDQTPSSLLAVLALRPEHFAGGVAPKQLMTRWDSFAGFHVADLFEKLINRLPLRARTAMPGRIPLGVAPYGGMLFHRSLIEHLGLPRLEFGQYGDDTEFTWRITSNGGRIIQIADAIVDDLEQAFQKNAQLRNRFLGALLTDSDFRTYYTFRNLAYFERRFRRRKPLLFTLNRIVYFSILRFYAHRHGLKARYTFIRDSSSEGLTGDLKPSIRFPLE